MDVMNGTTFLKKYKNLKYKIWQTVLPGSPSASDTPFADYINWIRFTRRSPEFPGSIDIQTKSGCNAYCSFCMVGKEENKIKGTMSDELFKKIIDEVMEYPNFKKINLYLLNEPLVDKKLPEKIEYVAKKKGNRKLPIVRITTNAGLLTEEMGDRILRAEGLDEMNFSFHSIIPEVYEKMMTPLKYDRVMGNIVQFKKMWDDYSGKKPKLTLWTVRTKSVLDNLKNEKAYWKNLGIGFKARKFDNRASSSMDEMALNDGEFQQVLYCVVLFRRAWVMWNGDMIMCCVDQDRTNLLGNCSGRSIKEIWNNANYQELRKRWRRKQLKGLICETCRST